MNFIIVKNIISIINVYNTRNDIMYVGYNIWYRK